MIQIAYFNTVPLIPNDEFKIDFHPLRNIEEVARHVGPLMLGLDSTNFESLRKIIIDRDQQVVLVLKNRKDFYLVPEMKTVFPKIFGFIDMSAEPEVAIPLLRNYINLNFSSGALQLDKLSNDLDKIEERTQTELRGIKELHDRFVKMRTEKIKGAELAVKFMAGEKSGGEFFDYIAQDSHMLFIQAGSDSYVMSSLIISAMEDLKIKKEMDMAREKLLKATFELLAPDAKKVALTGDFNSWDANGIKMRKYKSGKWKANVDCTPGRYEYKYIVDNEWWTDPNNTKSAVNSFGAVNSVIEL